MEYPKTENLLKRDEETHKLILGEFREPQFVQVQKWLVTEKIDGTNIRVILNWADGKPIVSVRGRSDAATLPKNFVQEALGEVDGFELTARMTNLALALTGKTYADFREQPVDVCVYGEGYGPGIQKVGVKYTSKKSLRIFDVVTFREGARPWWRPWEAVRLASEYLEVPTVPSLGWVSTENVISFVQQNPISTVALDEGGGLADPLPMEGVIARTDPYLYDWQGHRVMFKLKSHDLPWTKAEDSLTRFLKSHDLP